MEKKYMKAMKKNDEFSLFVPTAVQLAVKTRLRLNPPTFKNDIWIFWYLLDRIITGSTFIKNDPEFNEINQKRRSAELGVIVGPYLLWLKANDIILSNDKYSVGKVSKGYKVNPEFEFDFGQLNPPERITDKIKQHYKRKKAHYNRQAPFVKVMRLIYNELMQNSYDYNAAYTYIKQLNMSHHKKVVYMKSLKRLESPSARYFQVSKTNGRLNSNFTNMKKTLRRFIIGEWVEIDLKNSQPFLFAVVLNTLYQYYRGIDSLNKSRLDIIEQLEKTFSKKILNEVKEIILSEELKVQEEFDRYYHITLDGEFYETIKDAVNKNRKNKFDRNEIKKIILSVFFSQNIVYKNNQGYVPYSSYKKVFKKQFPIISEIITLLKQRNNSHLAIFLQRLESKIFIQEIARMVTAKEIKVLTIHDSLVFEFEKKDEVVEIIN